MARRRRPRDLTEEDARLWDRVAASTTPLPGRAPGKPEPTTSSAAAEPAAPKARPGRPVAPDPASAPRSTVPRPQPDPPARWLIEPFQLGARSGAGSAPRLTPPMAEQLHAAPLRMDPHTHRRLRKGKLTPESRIDLHGMTLASALPALTLFILRARDSGQRLVLVITGKGRGGGTDPGPLPTRPGALRHSVPHWLHMPPLSSAVAQVLPAHDRHGGGGAYYVWLRRPGR